MLQRSSTTVVGLEPASVRAYSLYRENEGARPIEDIDLMSAAVPFDMVRQLHGPLSKVMAEDDKELLGALRNVGFKLDNGEDDTGFFMKLLRYLGGYYINVGASNLIIDGAIKLKSGRDAGSHGRTACPLLGRQHSAARHGGHGHGISAAAGCRARHVRP